MFVRLSVRPSGTGVHCDHTMHVITDFSLWLDSPMFRTPWHQSISTYSQPSFPVPPGREVGYGCANVVRIVLEDRPGMDKSDPGQFRHFVFLIRFSAVFWLQICCKFIGHLFHDVHEKQQLVRWDTGMDSMTAIENGINRWDWEENGNKTWLNLTEQMEIEMNHWEREGVGLKKTFPLIIKLLNMTSTISNETTL